MKSSRLLLTFLGATAAVALGVVVWQGRIIAGLRAESAAVRQDLRKTLSVVLEQGPAGSGLQPSQRERLELIQLRHEMRDLRESLVEARATQPTGLKGLLNPLLPSATGPVRWRPEWKGMEQHASNTYAQAMQGVNNGTNEQVRFLSLHTAAKLSLAMGRAEEARRFAEDAMTLNEKYSRGAPEKANGDVVHDGNLVLGRLAADEGRLEDAKRHLLAAGRTRGSPILGSFGPNMGLAKDLLQRGEQATVLEYFELCRKFWANEKLDLWRKDVEAGRIPEFGGNLLY